MAVARDYALNPSLRRATAARIDQPKRSHKHQIEATVDSSAVRVCVENCKGCSKDKAQLLDITTEDVFVVTHLLEDLLKLYGNVCFCSGGKDSKICNTHFSNMCNPSAHARLIRDIIKRIEARNENSRNSG
jgi:hypothetical protein